MVVVNAERKRGGYEEDVGFECEKSSSSREVMRRGARTSVERRCRARFGE